MALGEQELRAQNLTDGKLPTWREGRAWCGKWRAEWYVFRQPSLAIHVRAGGYNDNEIQFHLACLIFSFFVSRGFRRSFDERELGLSWHDGCVWLKLWCDDHGYRDRPWHRNTICFHVVEWFTGRAKCEVVNGETVEVMVPMPEGCYRARVTPETYTWTWRFGYQKVRHSYWLRIEGGIPFSGKGENSWDCGDDGLWAIGGETLEEAIGNAVASVLTKRRRYGRDSRNTGAVAIAILN